MEIVMINHQELIKLESQLNQLLIKKREELEEQKKVWRKLQEESINWNVRWTYYHESVARWKLDHIEPLLSAIRIINRIIDDRYEIFPTEIVI